MKRIARLRMTGCLVAASLFRQRVLFDNAARADETRLFKYRDTPLLGGISAGTTTSSETCALCCEVRSACLEHHHHRETQGWCRLVATVSGAIAERGRSAVARLTTSGYRLPAEQDAPESASMTSRWVHNGSVIKVRTAPGGDGSADIERYSNPKSQLPDVGILPGSILFKGSLVDGALLVKARIRARDAASSNTMSKDCSILRRECHFSSQPGPGTANRLDRLAMGEDRRKANLRFAPS